MNFDYYSNLIFFIVFTLMLIIYIIYKKSKRNEELPEIDGSHRLRNEKQLPPYPNAWTPVLESRDLKKSQIKPVFAFGKDLVVFRGASGKVYVLDAYCPHMGANLGVGGTVIDEEIKCPFHGWIYDFEGKCTAVPGLERKDIPRAQIKYWDSLEVNGFIFIWYHSLGEKPNYVINRNKDLDDEKFVYALRMEHSTCAHLCEMLENGTDSSHFNSIHSAADFLGTVLKKAPFYDIIIKYFYLEYDVKFKICAEPYVSQIMLRATNHLGPLQTQFLAKFNIIGPNFALIKINLFGQVYLIAYNAFISDGPCNHRLIWNFYNKKNSLLSYLMTIYACYFLKVNVIRDSEIINKKIFLEKPIFTRSETQMKPFRCWFKQFFTDPYY